MDSNGNSQHAWTYSYKTESCWLNDIRDKPAPNVLVSLKIEPGSLNDISDKYARGIHVKRSELVEALELHRGQYIPNNIAPLICGYLRRDIKSPRGRHARQEHDMDYYVEAMDALYKKELARLRQLKKEHGSLRGCVRPEFENMAPNEIAAALVALKCPQLNITGRRVQNLISAYKTRKR